MEAFKGDLPACKGQCKLPPPLLCNISPFLLQQCIFCVLFWPSCRWNSFFSLLPWTECHCWASCQPYYVSRGAFYTPCLIARPFLSHRKERSTKALQRTSKTCFFFSHNVPEGKTTVAKVCWQAQERRGYNGQVLMLGTLKDVFVNIVSGWKVVSFYRRIRSFFWPWFVFFSIGRTTISVVRAIGLIDLRAETAQASSHKDGSHPLLHRVYPFFSSVTDALCLPLADFGDEKNAASIHVFL